MKDITRIDIGCGGLCEPGYEPWDIKDGRLAESLEGIEDGQLDAIKASHVLEHIPYSQTAAVLAEWARALKIGGELRVAVPDFDKIVNAYESGSSAIEGVLMGGQIDSDDFHKAIFNRQKLTQMLGLARFDVVGDWEESIPGSCAQHPVSINLKAKRRWDQVIPLSDQRDVTVVMSLPRLAWTENMHCVLQACSQLKMKYARHTGVFWGQCLQRVMQDCLKDETCKYIVTVDYDSVFEPKDIIMLRTILEQFDLDFLAPLQAARERDQILAMLDDGNGNPLTELSPDHQRALHWPCLTAHFGLTMIRTDALRKMPMPWFLGIPEPDGSWGDNRVDDDIYFWRKVRELGLKASITSAVRIGHIQTMCSWVRNDLRPAHQYMADYLKKGALPWKPIEPQS